MGDSSGVPTGVKIISVLDYIGAVIVVLLGIAFLIGASAFGSLTQEVPLLALIGSGFFLVVGIILLLFGILFFFIARGLWNGRNWARILSIILLALGLLFAVIGMINGNIAGNLFVFVYDVVVGGYLLFSSKVKQAFS